MMKKILILWTMIIAGLSTGVAAQSNENIRGIIVDAASGQSLPYVTVTVLNTNPILGATTDGQGAF
ncbi:MAG: carboxypeptidase-like regulatory domain-containing protein, partial [Prevotellaceae bacterium]|nr:carboxypeptidase-like regulatory domain-containing protein [Prevotellaceae bacterium]